MSWPRWAGKLVGAVAGALLLRANPLLGAVLGALIGHAFDAGWLSPRPRRAPPPPQPDDDYRILGIDPSISDEDLDRAYRKLMSQYHPDRVAGAADEFREIAEQRSRAINAAYDRVCTRRRHAARNQT